MPEEPISIYLIESVSSGFPADITTFAVSTGSTKVTVPPELCTTVTVLPLAVAVTSTDGCAPAPKLISPPEAFIAEANLEATVEGFGPPSTAT